MTKNGFFPFKFWDSSSTHSSDINAFWGVCVCVCMCQPSATFIKGHSLAESFVLCNRFIQILNTQIWAQPPSKAAIIIQDHFPARVEENAPVIHNIIISFPWQHQKDCTISNRPKPGQQWSYTEHSLPPAPNKAAIRWWLFFTCPPTGRNISQPVETELNQTSSPPSPASTATVPAITITGLTSSVCDMFGSWTSVNHLKDSVWMCSSKTQQLISTCHKQALSIVWGWGGNENHQHWWVSGRCWAILWGCGELPSPWSKSTFHIYITYTCFSFVHIYSVSIKTKFQLHTNILCPSVGSLITVLHLH